MPPSKIPNSVSKLILELADQQKEPAEIAQILNLKKVQVTTLLAYHRLVESKAHTQEVEVSTPIATEEFVESRLEEEDADEPQAPAPAVAVVAPDETSDEDEEETAKDAGVYVGDDEYGDAVSWNPQDAGAVTNPHLMIMGESGSGKTYAVQCLVFCGARFRRAENGCQIQTGLHLTSTQ